MTRPAKRSSVIFLIAVFAISAAAYDHPLQSLAIRDAYFLGADSHQSAEFLSHYMKDLPVPKSGPYVSVMEVRTPFAQVVANSHDHSAGYSAQDAEQDYRKNPDTVQVRVQIIVAPLDAVGAVTQVPAACMGVQRMNSALDCFHDFRFRFFQQNQNLVKFIQPQSSYGVPFYSGNGVFYAGDVWFTFRASRIASAPLQVSVTRSDGQKFSAEFDLSTLR